MCLSMFPLVSLDEFIFLVDSAKIVHKQCHWVVMSPYQQYVFLSIYQSFLLTAMSHISVGGKYFRNLQNGIGKSTFPLTFIILLFQMHDWLFRFPVTTVCFLSGASVLQERVLLVHNWDGCKLEIILVCHQSYLPQLWWIRCLLTCPVLPDGGAQSSFR